MRAAKEIWCDATCVDGQETVEQAEAKLRTYLTTLRANERFTLCVSGRSMEDSALFFADQPPPPGVDSSHWRERSQVQALYRSLVDQRSSSFQAPSSSVTRSAPREEVSS